MLYLAAIALGIAAGIMAGGKISNVLDFKIKKAWLIILSLLIQISAQIAVSKGIDFIQNYLGILQFAVYALLITAFYYNRQYIGMCIIAAGSILNAIVMIANGGRMPVNADILERLNLMEGADAVNSGQDIKHVFMDESTKLPFLGDIVHPPSFLSCFMQVVSIGDIVITAGLLVLVFEIVRGRYKGVKTY
jgi:hypothetical protein